VYFLGTFDYAMDERGRVPIPPRYRDAFRTGAVLSLGSPSPCVRVYTQEAFESMASEATVPSTMSQKGRDLRLALFARSHAAEPDQQGRLLIPRELREAAGLSGKVFVVGAGECLQVWSPAALAREMDRIEATLPATMESVADRR
jgi:MraZ protein